MLSCLCGASDANRLLHAAKTGDTHVVVGLIKKKPKLAHAQQWGGQTAWHLAAKEGHEQVLQALADAIHELSIAELQQLSSQGRTAEKIIRTLAQEGDTKCLTPLHLACIKGHAAAAALLMKFGVNPFLMDSVGRTALHYAASWGHADCINAVLNAHSGPPKPEWRVSWPNDEDTKLVNVQNLSGFTPLHYAVWVGRREAIQALASYDASLEVVNNSNDYDWIKVGAGNTPLHLAAFGGDFDVVKLLLAAHVQTLAAGAEVMAAGQGQWGQRYANDVRHMRNRRGLMPYHIAVHKHFQNLTELLHPDIPYTFIFSNDDMDVGSVRMYGPARLMVIAAKALQQKLISELEAVEKAAIAASPKAAANGAAAAAADGAATVLVDAGAGSSVVNEQVSSIREHSVQQHPDVRDAAAAAAAAVSTADAVTTEEVASPTGEVPLLSPFAAKSYKHWTSTSTGLETISPASATPASSIGAGGPSAASAAAPPTAAGQITRLTSETDQSLASTAAAVDIHSSLGGSSSSTAVAAAVAAPAVVGAPIGGVLAATGEREAPSAFEIHAAKFEPMPAEFSFAAEPGSQAAGLSVSATVPASLLAGVNSSKDNAGRLQAESSFRGFGNTPAASAAAEQQQYSSAASDADASAMSGSTIPGSTSAVAGTPAGSINLQLDYASVASSTRGGYASSSKTPAAVSAVHSMSNGQRGSASGAQRAHSNSSSMMGSIAVADDGLALNGSTTGDTRQLAAAAAGAAATAFQDASVHSVALPENATANMPSDVPKGMRHRRVQSTVDQRMYGRQSSKGHSRRATAEGLEGRRSGWLQSMGSFSRMQTRRDFDDVLPPSAVVTTAADDDSNSMTQRQQQQQQQYQRRSSIGQPSRFSVTGAAARISSSVDNVSPRPSSITEPQEVPIGDEMPEAVQRKGCTNQRPSPGARIDDNPLDVILANRASTIGEDPEAMRQQLVLMKLASGMLNFQTAVSAFNAAQVDALDASRMGSTAAGALGWQPNHTTVPLMVTASSPLEAGLAAAAQDGSAANQAAASEERFTSVTDSLAGRSAAAGQLTKSNSLAALRNSSCRCLIAKQPSLKRLLSGKTSRSSLVTSAGVSGDNAVAAAAAAAAAAAEMAAAPDGDAGTVTPAMTATGELPIIQQRTLATARMITEEDECESDAEECEVCFDAQAVVQLQQCGHTLCVGCCKEMCKLHHFKPALCPYCRQIICGFALQK